MNSIRVNFPRGTALVSTNAFVDQVRTQIASSAHDFQYQSNHALVALAHDRSYQDHINELVSKKRAIKPKILVVIGIGGSNLGTYAVQIALHGVFYNGSHDRPHVYFADTIDPDYIAHIQAVCQKELENKNEILIVVISKSGTTAETVINAQILIDLLKKYRPDYAQFVVAITDENSKLWPVSQKLGIDVLAIPRMVGGRFSIFSAVGLFPLGMLGVDIQALCAGAASMIDACTNAAIEKNPALQSALFIYEQARSGKNIHDTFVFCAALEGVGKWYRQLMGESIGKLRVNGGKTEHVGITPTVSVGTVDLHSVLQLYIAGPNDRTTTFITVRDWQHALTVASVAGFDTLVDHVQGKSMSAIMDAIIKGVQKVYVQKDRPFGTIEIPELNAYYLGQLMQMKMIEMIYLGALLDVSVFDQPQVELYKDETRKILAHE